MKPISASRSTLIKVLGPSRGGSLRHFPFPPQPPSVRQAIADQCVDAVVAGAKAAQLDALSVGNLLGVAVTPLDGYVAVSVSVDEHVEGAVACQLGEEGDRGGDLAEDGGDLVLYLLFCLFGVGGWGGCAVGQDGG